MISPSINSFVLTIMGQNLLSPDLHSSGVSAVTPRSLSPLTTPTADVPSEANPEETEDQKDLFATLRHYAVKVDKQQQPYTHTSLCVY